MREKQKVTHQTQKDLDVFNGPCSVNPKAKNALSLNSLSLSWIVSFNCFLRTYGPLIFKFHHIKYSTPPFFTMFRLLVTLKTCALALWITISGPRFLSLLFISLAGHLHFATSTFSSVTSWDYRPSLETFLFLTFRMQSQ